MTHRPTRAVLAALTITALTTVGACTREADPAPTPTTTTTTTATPSPTPTATLTEQDQNIAAAKDAYLAWVAAYDAAAQAGFIDRDLYAALLALTGGGDARNDVVDTQATFEEFGLVQTGDTVVRSVEATAYEEDTSGGGMHGVRLRACVDLSGVDFVSSDGTSSSPGDYRGPRNVYVHTIKQEQVWLIQSADARPEEQC